MNDQDGGRATMAEYEINEHAFESFSTASTCPSLAPSLFVNTGSSLSRLQRTGSYSRSESSQEVEQYSDSSLGTVSPATPLQVGNHRGISGMDAMYDDDDETFLRMSEAADGKDIQALTTTWQSKTDPYAHMYVHGFQSNMVDFYHQPDHPVLAATNMNAVLSRDIFHEPQTVTTMMIPNCAAPFWSNMVPDRQPDTVVPSETFQGFVSSSPVVKSEPMTPPRRMPCSRTVVLSSPASGYSPDVLRSQPEFEDYPQFFSDNISMILTPERRLEPSGGRLAKRSYSRKIMGVTSKPKPVTNKSGIECEEIIAQNSFPCDYGCRDKNGKLKKFKRQEHKKRHEKTVHEKDKHDLHKCWVPLCVTAPFARTDNLKSHQIKTHGKKSSNARNRYVATLDATSSYWNPEWQGELTEAGLPVM